MSGQRIKSMRLIKFLQSTAGVAKGAAAESVDCNEEDDGGDVEDGELVPVTSHLLQNAGFTRIAVVAENVSLVAPLIAVLLLISRCHPRHICARCRRLTASRLRTHFKFKCFFMLFKLKIYAAFRTIF
ncbi:hypothetical protein IEQ34_005534 [Dendrobium chrysotoxum]|uniref:Uncharacterized protein n=1 Tax=Dendrobium chrysotoxum TaxID=161865 RepID=A0AAV7H968_DENCH|nr:hypothetical protein IEQ34_005534 [Dendrobium chrysotoxum]